MSGDRYLFSEEVVELERQLRRQAEARAERERQERDLERQQREEMEERAVRAEAENDVLRQQLRELGIDPDML